MYLLIVAISVELPIYFQRKKNMVVLLIARSVTSSSKFRELNYDNVVVIFSLHNDYQVFLQVPQKLSVKKKKKGFGVFKETENICS